MTVFELLIFAMPFLLSLFGQGATTKVLCLLASLMTMLLSVEPGGAYLPWFVGTLIAAVSVRERSSSGAPPELWPSFQTSRHRKNKGAAELLPPRPIIRARWSRAESAPMPGLQSRLAFEPSGRSQRGDSAW